MIDAAIVGLDRALRTLFVTPSPTRPTPGAALCSPLSPEERRHAGALMRVNHVGEICAQALYRGQALACRSTEIRRELECSAQEESDHLAWTDTRIDELGSRKSLLNPLWYLASLSLGYAVGKLGDGPSLGFLAETERQVERHLEGHLAALPACDARSREIVRQMKDDEAAHAATALRLGGGELPVPARTAMRLAASVMTSVAYRL